MTINLRNLVINRCLILILNRLVEEGGVLTDCSIRTQEPEEILDFNFSSADVLNKIIMKVLENNSKQCRLLR